jgi:hypothetical protein
MVRVVGAPTQEVGVIDILLSSLGLVGLIVLASVLLGLAVGGLLIGLKRWRPANSVNGQTADSRGLNLTPLPPGS